MSRVAFVLCEKSIKCCSICSKSHLLFLSRYSNRVYPCNSSPNAAMGKFAFSLPFMVSSPWSCFALVWEFPLSSFHELGAWRGDVLQTFEVRHVRDLDEPEFR